MSAKKIEIGLEADEEFKPVLIRTYYDGLQAVFSDGTATLNLEPSLTKQEFQDECDINSIMAKFEKTGEILHSNEVTPRYGDFTLVPDYQSALNFVAESEAMFASLPSKARDRFANQPEQFLAFVSDPANIPEMKALGLFNPPPASDGVSSPAVEAQAAPAAPSTSTPS